MFAIPREQIVRVGQRRSLMKRALVGIVPDEILNRKKREAVPQESLKSSPKEPPRLLEIGPHLTGSSVGILDPDRFGEALQKAQRNEEAPIEGLKRTLTLESWLRHLTIHGALTNPSPIKKQVRSTALEAKELQEPTQPKSLAS